MAWLQVEFSSILKPGPPAVALNPVNDARPAPNRPQGMAKVEVSRSATNKAGASVAPEKTA